MLAVERSRPVQREVRAVDLKPHPGDGKPTLFIDVETGRFVISLPGQDRVIGRIDAVSQPVRRIQIYRALRATLLQTPLTGLEPEESLALRNRFDLEGTGIVKTDRQTAWELGMTVYSFGLLKKRHY